MNIPELINDLAIRTFLLSLRAVRRPKHSWKPSHEVSAEGFTVLHSITPRDIGS